MHVSQTVLVNLDISFPPDHPQTQNLRHGNRNLSTVKMCDVGKLC